MHVNVTCQQQGDEIVSTDSNMLPTAPSQKIKVSDLDKQALNPNKVCMTIDPALMRYSRLATLEDSQN